MRRMKIVGVGVAAWMVLVVIVRPVTESPWAFLLGAVIVSSATAFATLAYEHGARRTWRALIGTKESA